MIIKMKDEKDNIIETHPALDLLKQPNILQGTNEYIFQSSVFEDLFGNNYIHNLKGVKETAALYNLPSSEAKVIPTESIKNGTSIIFNQTDLNKIIKQYEFKYMNGVIIYKPEDIIHINNVQMITTSNVDDYLKGISKVGVLTQACENIITAYQARGVLQGNSPIGIIANQTKDGTGSSVLDPEAKKAVQEELKKYGLKHKKYQFITTGMDLAFRSMAVNVGQLKLHEEVKEDLQAIANQYSFPAELFSKDVTYDNKREVEKQLYQDSIIPDSNNWLKTLSKGLGLLEEGKVLFADFSHVAVLQDDLEKRSKMWVFAVKAMNQAKGDGVLTDEEYKANLKKIGMIN
jgi:phage portal protein BeeE